MQVYVSFISTLFSMLIEWIFENPLLSIPFAMLIVGAGVLAVFRVVSF